MASKSKQRVLWIEAWKVVIEMVPRGRAQQSERATGCVVVALALQLCANSDRS